MRRFTGIAAAVAFMPGAAGLGGSAQAGPMPIAGANMTGSEALPLEEVQFVWGGRNYCWYSNGWQGPGWYWCGYRWRRGYGWGGGYGWHGGVHPGRHSGYSGGEGGHGRRRWRGRGGPGGWAGRGRPRRLAGRRRPRRGAWWRRPKVAARRVTDPGGLPI